MILDYISAKGLDQALQAISENPKHAEIIAGGTDSFLRFTKEQRTRIVVDIGRIRNLDFVKREGEWVEIGAATPLSKILSIPWLLKEVPSIGEAFSRVGSPQIRNQATAVGNIMTARAVANVRVWAVSVGASLKMRDIEGERGILVEELDAGARPAGRGRIAVSLTIPLNEATRTSSYQCFTPRKGFSYASATASACIQIEGGSFSSVILAASPIFPSLKKTSRTKPCTTCGGSCRICKIVRLTGLEQDLAGRKAVEAEIEEVCNVFDWDQIPMRDSLVNGPAEYRRHLLKVLSRRALIKALKRKEVRSQ
jgi:carbon-monoxide dehydrogenase medium subunit